jgi:hypothetical protein
MATETISDGDQIDDSVAIGVPSLRSDLFLRRREAKKKAQKKPGSGGSVGARNTMKSPTKPAPQQQQQQQQQRQKQQRQKQQRQKQQRQKQQRQKQQRQKQRGIDESSFTAAAAAGALRGAHEQQQHLRRHCQAWRRREQQQHLRRHCQAWRRREQ